MEIIIFFLIFLFISDLVFDKPKLEYVSE